MLFLKQNLLICMIFIAFTKTAKTMLRLQRHVWVSSLSAIIIMNTVILYSHLGGPKSTTSVALLANFCLWTRFFIPSIFDTKFRLLTANLKIEDNNGTWI